MNEINFRIKLVIEKSELSIHAFTIEIGAATGILSNAFKNDTSLSLETILKIVKRYNVNANWLLTGEGEMFRGEEKNTVPTIQMSYDSLKTIEDKLEAIQQQLANLSNKK